MKFRATVESNGATATGVVVPNDVVTGLKGGGRPPVIVTIGQHTYRTSIGSRGGRYMVPLSRENRDLAGVAAGDVVDVTIELDTAPREVDVPADFAAAMATEPGLRDAFDRMPYTHRKEHVRAIEEAKAEATRQRRIDSALTALRERAAR